MDQIIKLDDDIFFGVTSKKIFLKPEIENKWNYLETSCLALSVKGLSFVEDVDAWKTITEKVRQKVKYMYSDAENETGYLFDQVVCELNKKKEEELKGMPYYDHTLVNLNDYTVVDIFEETLYFNIEETVTWDMLSATLSDVNVKKIYNVHQAQAWLILGKKMGGRIPRHFSRCGEDSSFFTETEDSMSKIENPLNRNGLAMTRVLERQRELEKIIYQTYDSGPFV